MADETRILSDSIVLSDSYEIIPTHIIERILSETINVSDSIKSNFMEVFELNPSSGGVESLSASRKSGWVSVSDLSRKNFVRRINARYQSADIVNIKLFTDGDDVNEVWSGSFPANSSNGKKYASRRVGIRAKHLMVSFELDTSVSYGQEINRIEVEVDD